VHRVRKQKNKSRNKAKGELIATKITAIFKLNRSKQEFWVSSFEIQFKDD
jgi:hypothetical protein